MSKSQLFASSVAGFVSLAWMKEAAGTNWIPLLWAEISASLERAWLASELGFVSAQTVAATGSKPKAKIDKAMIVKGL